MRTYAPALATTVGIYHVRETLSAAGEGERGAGFLVSVVRPDAANGNGHDVHFAATEEEAWSWCHRDAAYLESLQRPPLWYDDASYGRYQAGDYVSNREE